MPRILVLAAVPCALLFMSTPLAAQVGAATNPTDTPFDDAPTAVQRATSIDPADDSGYGTTMTPTPQTTVGGTATIRRGPGAVAGGVAATGSLAAPDARAPAGTLAPNAPPAGTALTPGTNITPLMVPTRPPETDVTAQLAPGGTTALGGGVGAFAPGLAPPGAYTTGGWGAPITFAPGVGYPAANVLGQDVVGGAVGTPIALPSGVAIGNDLLPYTQRQAGESAPSVAESAPPMQQPPVYMMPMPMPAPEGAPATAGAAPTTAGLAPTAAGAASTTAEPAPAAEVAAQPIELTPGALSADTDAFDGRRVTMRSTVADVDNRSVFTVRDARVGRASDVVVVVPAPLSDNPLSEDVIVTGTVRPFSLDEMRKHYPQLASFPELQDALAGKRVLVAESVIQLER